MGKRLESKQGNMTQRILYLKAASLETAPEDMGYAHGYLVAEDILNYLREGSLEDFYQVNQGSENVVKYEWIRDYAQQNMRLSDEHEREVKAIFEGLQAYLSEHDQLSDLYYEPLQRNLDWIDLKLVQFISDFFGVLCKSVGAWDNLIDATGQRMLTYHDDWTRKMIEMRSFLCMYDFPEGSPKKDCIQLVFPGVISHWMSGMNEIGMGAALSSAGPREPFNYQRPIPEDERSSDGSQYRSILEIGGIDIPDAFATHLEGRRFLPTDNLQIADFYGESDPPFQVAEIAYALPEGSEEIRVALRPPEDDLQLGPLNLCVGVDSLRSLFGWTSAVYERYKAMLMKPEYENPDQHRLSLPEIYRIKQSNSVGVRGTSTEVWGDGTGGATVQ